MPPVLSRVQKNQIAELAGHKSLDAADFEWSASLVEGNHFERVVHRPTGGWFRVLKSHGGTWTTWWPDYETVEGGKHCSVWPEALACAERWIHTVGEDHEAPDLWALARRRRDLLAPDTDPRTLAAEGVGDAPFTAEERIQLRDAIAEIGRFVVQTNQLQGETRRLLEARLGYLTDAVDRLGRFDFKNVFASVLMEVVILAGMQSPAANALYAFVSTLLASKLAGLLPP
jgi:hypothetical protein